MDYPTYSSQFSQVPEKPKSKGVILLLIGSLALNAYFLKEQFGEWTKPDDALATTDLLMEPEPMSYAPPEMAGSEIRTPAEPEITETKKAAPVKNPQSPYRSLKFTVNGSLNRTLCGLLPDSDCEPLAQYVARALMWSMDMNSDLRKGDPVQLVYEQLEPGEFRILHLAYHSQALKRTIEMNYHKPAGMKYGGWFDPEGKEIAQRLKKSHAPIRDYSEITSLPGDFRQGTFRGHSGTDFKAPTGTPLYAPFEGRVNRVNWNRRSNGYCIELDHPREGIRTLYLHLERVMVKRGQYVQPGDQIGTSGNTGRSFAPHLHYEVQKRNKRRTIVNPFHFKYHPTYRRTLSDLASYREVVAGYQQQLESSLS